MTGIELRTPEHVLTGKISKFGEIVRPDIAIPLPHQYAAKIVIEQKYRMVMEKSGKERNLLRKLTPVSKY